MPATEQTWRDQKLMHKVFGASCFVLLLSTIWMFAADHDREWKVYQDTARGIDLQMTNWQKLQFQTDEWMARHKELKAALASVEGQDIPATLLGKFEKLVPGDYKSSGIDGLAGRLHEAADDAEKVRSGDAQDGSEHPDNRYVAAKVAREDAQLIAQETAKAADDAEGKVAAAENKDEAKAVADAARAKANDAITQLETAIANEEKAKKQADEAEQELIDAERVVAKRRSSVLNALDGIVAGAKYQEVAALKGRKFRSADLDAAKANLGLAVRDSLSIEAQQELQSIVDEVTNDVAELNTAYEKAADLRQQLQDIVKEMTRDEDKEIEKLEKDESLNKSKLDGLNRTIASQRSNFFEFYGIMPVPGKRWLELPILDAFNSPRKIDNLWSEGLLQDYNFSKVRRFDRCSTCHKSIDKTAPGTADEPGYVHERLLTFSVPAASHDDFSSEAKDSYALQVYGMRLALEGLVTKTDVTVSFVQPKSIAARASLQEAESRHDEKPAEDLRMAMLRAAGEGEEHSSADSEQGLVLGDVIVAVNGDDVRGREQTIFRLRQLAEDGESFSVTVRRGLPNPYISHPRLDLFVGSLSPHKMSDFACTICHDGQGSGTEFKWVSHMPDSEKERKRWSREHGWFDNHHWIYPMNPKRFAESLCLKCHHEVVELEPSEKFPDPPAPKLMHGYNLIRKYGCYGCHEINGYDGPDKRIGPDLRMEPNIFAAAQQFKGMPDSGYDNLSDRGKELVAEVTDHPDRDGARRELLQIILEDSESDEPRFSDDVHSTIGSLLKDSEAPGKLRRPGPSLRFVGEKLDGNFLFDWIDKPKHFRPTTRMPQFFGLWDHMKGDAQSLRVAKEYEPIEILGIIAYLRNRSQEFVPLEPPEGITETTAEEKVGRGKLLFQERGCLACHAHEDFPDTAKYRGPDEIVQGPDLSAVGSKFAADRNPVGAKWLYSWIKQPTRYHVRTVMPDLFLDPIEHKDAEGNVTITDPVADIVAYLLTGVDSEWKPADGYSAELSGAQSESLDKLVMEHLRDSFYEETAKKYLDSGIPERVRDQVKVAEHEMIVPNASHDDKQFKITEAQKLVYTGRKSLIKYGCYGCHDVPGFEDAKPIGTGLADWGRKEPAKLAFEHIAQYLHHKEEHAEHSHDHEDGHDDHAADLPSDYYMHQIHGGHRQGFIYQKLAEPRSYDYHKTLNKKYNERLRMPQFPFDVGEREAVITFVLGLVSDPPTEKYVYKPSPREEAIIAGRRVIEKYNCGGCHVLEGEKWDITYPADFYGKQNVKPGFPFVFSNFTPAELAASAEADRQNLLHATLTGVPAIGDDGKPVVYDEEGDPVQLSGPDAIFDPTTVEYGFDLWKPTVIDGNPYDVGELSLIVPAKQISKRYESDGGFLTNYLLPHAVAREKLLNPNAKGSEARGWLPPPLVGEGNKVQSNWLYEFLLDPHPIRPAVLLRMPRFNLSAAEATDLVNYFSAIDNSEYPYEFASRRRSEHLATASEQYRQKLEEGGEAVDDGAFRRFDDAMKIVTDNNYCVKCHLVGDFVPGGADRAKAPNLAAVYERMRPDYVRRWIAKPTGFLPYTSMPVNVPYDASKEHLGGVKQELYHGTSVEQVDALVDLLINFDVYAKQRSLIAPLVKPPPAGGAENTTAGESASE